ncbi:Alpha/beta hydrolase fold-1 [Xylaria sp. CBS 124048]|nr:Alpha/beta hydrolase fold-1 [Xylaria sp. CBS 124048]
MSQKKPIIVCVPGAWCMPEIYTPTTDILAKAGYTCLTVALPGVGFEQRSPEDKAGPKPVPGLQDDASAVREVVLSQLDAGHDVVLVCHSYGGVVGSEAVRGLDRASRGNGNGNGTGAVIHLVYIAAIIVDVGGQVWPGGKTPEDGNFIVQGDVCWRDASAPGSERFLSCCDEAAINHIVKYVRPHTFRCFADPITHTAWRHIPGTYVVAKEDVLPNQMALAPADHRFEEIVELEADHFAICGAPGPVAEVIQRAAEKAIAVGP